MLDIDNPQLAGGIVIAIALLLPILYSFFVDKHKKGTPDPRQIKHQ